MLSKSVKKEKGITLVALAVTIIVLIILASIGINLAFSDNGIIKEAQNAKESAEIDEEQGILKRAVNISLIKSKGANVEQSTLENALNDEIGEGKTEVSNVGEYFEVMFTETNRYYEVDENGKIGEVQHFVKDEYAGDITKGGRCDGSEEKPYEISCIEDLVVFSNMSNKTGIKFENGEAVEVTQYNNFADKYIVLTKSLNFQSKYSYADSTRTDFGDINGDDTDGNMLITEMTTGAGFPTICSWYSGFSGFFDGEGNSILNIESAGLFGRVSNSEIKNLTITGNITSEGFAGGIVGGQGYNANSKIINCINKASVTGKESVGGIAAGYVDVYNCKNYGTITIEKSNYAYAGAGGIVGIASHNAIENGIIISGCQNYGKIKGDYSIGGIVGNSTGKLSVINCMNMSDFSSSSDAGGIAGTICSGKTLIKNCINTGNISANRGCGGITLGFEGWWNKEITIENCANIGNIKAGSTNAGGIIGWQNKDTRLNICNSWNLGKVEGKTAGYILGKIVTSSDTETKTEMYNVYCTGVTIGSGSLTGGEITQVTETEIKSRSFVDLLNSYTDDTGGYPADWKKWKMGDEGYPIFEE